jgi:hypothetical protein
VHGVGGLPSMKLLAWQCAVTQIGAAGPIKSLPVDIVVGTGPG